jgi:hypothetical protein
MRGVIAAESGPMSSRLMFLLMLKGRLAMETCVMDYGAIVREAWSLTRRFRFLWVFGLFAGGAVGVWTGGSAPHSGMGPGATPGIGLDAEREAALAAAWLTQHLGLVIAATAALALLGLTVLVLALISQGALAEATAEVASGEPSSFRHAWRVGAHLAWRYLGLWLLLGAAAIALAALVGTVVAAAAGIGQALELTASPLLVALGLLVGVPLALAAGAGAIAANVVVAYAQRAIAVEDVGVLASLRSGWRLLRTHLRESALLWLVNVALALVSGLAAGLVVATCAAILVGVGLLVYAGFGLIALTVAYTVVGGIALVATVALAVAIVNTYFWNYWTLAYLRLSGQRPHLSAGWR